MRRQPPMWLESAVDRLDMALLVVGLDHTVHYANLAAHRLFGVAPGALEGSAIDQLIAPERRGELRNVDEVMRGGGARRVRSAIKRDDGSRLDVTMTLEPCIDAAGRVGAVSVRYEAVAPGSRTTLTPAQRSSRPPHERSQPPLGSQPAPFERPLSPLGSRPVLQEPRPPAKLSPPPFASALSGPAPRHSEPRLSRARTMSELEVKLARLAQNLQWLEERLSVPSSVAPLDDASERARALLVVSESRALVQQSAQELDDAPTAEIPAPPKVSKL